MLSACLETQVRATIDHQAGTGFKDNLLPGLNDQGLAGIRLAATLHTQLIVGTEYDGALSSDLMVVLAGHLNRV